MNDYINNSKLVSDKTDSKTQNLDSTFICV